VKNLSEINGAKSAICDPRSAPPLDLIGGSGRFSGARTSKRDRLAAAVIDTTVGTGELVISRDGVRAYRVQR
jgi:hypothetical protein